MFQKKSGETKTLTMGFEERYRNKRKKRETANELNFKQRQKRKRGKKRGPKLVFVFAQIFLKDFVVFIFAGNLSRGVELVRIV